MIIASYERVSKTTEFNIPKPLLNQDNFVTSLNYMELEDLVSQFIYERHYKEGYILLPSSCKINKQNYEFSFVSVNRNPITCQVKNQSDDIIPNEYNDEKSYEKIYLFSGKWKDEDIDKYRKEYAGTNIYIISKEELYNEFMKNSYLKAKLEKFYDI